MTRRVVEKHCTKKVCVDFLAPKKGDHFEYDSKFMSFWGLRALCRGSQPEVCLGNDPVGLHGLHRVHYA